MSEISGRGPRMSVVIPNYNHGHLIEDALLAISQQTLPPSEVVVVDDGSTDDSLARLQSSAARMPWLRIRAHGENRGVNAACNTGLELVSGDFVLFSPADDRLDAETVERASAAAAAFPTSGIVFSDQAEMSADGATRKLMPLDLPPERRHFSPGEFVRLMQRNFFYFHVSSVWFNVKLLRALGGFPPELRWHGDLFAAYAAAFEQGAT
jgi:glycosyltransferase involved in cell wall biosynthesis